MSCIIYIKKCVKMLMIDVYMLCPSKGSYNCFPPGAGPAFSTILLKHFIHFEYTCFFSLCPHLVSDPILALAFLAYHVFMAYRRVGTRSLQRGTFVIFSPLALQPLARGGLKLFMSFCIVMTF